MKNRNAATVSYVKNNFAKIGLSGISRRRQVLLRAGKSSGMWNAQQGDFTKLKVGSTVTRW
jgi:hypothetical protein